MNILDANNIGRAHEIAQYIEGLHGATIRATDLAKRFDMHPSHIRGCINLARTEGLPVCSNPKGYFWSDARADIEQTVDHMRDRIHKQQDAINGLLAAAGMEANHEQQQ